MTRFRFSFAVFVSLVLTATGWAAAPLPRERSLNPNWKFHRGDAIGAENPDFNDRSWRVVNLPHDWSIEDLPSRQQDPLFLVVSLVPGEWKFSIGDNSEWKSPEFDDSAWRGVQLPETWDKHGQHGENATGWYRRHFTIPAGSTNKTVMLELGGINEQDWMYIDGKLVHESSDGYWSNNYRRMRTVELTGELAKPGEHIIAVKVRSVREAGGFVGLPAMPVNATPFDPGRSAGNLDTGYAVGGTGWYRLHFEMAKADAGKQVTVFFDGSYMETTVWINGHRVGRNVYGYSPFMFDLTPYLKHSGDMNVLAVRVVNNGRNSRWYSGSGLFRPVKMIVTNPLHVVPWSVAVSTLKVEQAAALVRVRADLTNSGVELQTLVRVHLLDFQGKSVSAIETNLFVPSDGASAVLDMSVASPQLWSPSSPSLYKAVVTVLTGKTTLDETTTTFGIRTLTWSAETGLLLNSEGMKLKGGCVHHDHGLLGAAAFPRAEERRVELLKAAGYNAIRCSHNMPSTSFLEACDRLGMLVVDEAFDMWNKSKTPQDYSRFFKENWQRDLGAMVRRDRNHPSVIMWSIGNEIPERGDASGVKTAKELADFVRSIDPTRPVTAAYNGVGEGADPFLATLDICGYNYCPDSFEPDHKRVPNRVMMTTESFPNESFKYWSRVEQFPYVVGDFIWTAWDYRGESGIGHTLAGGEMGTYLMGWPWNNSNCGDFDLCGFTKPQGLYRQVMWDVRKIAILVENQPGRNHARPDLWGWRDESASWTWPGTEGKERTVRVYAKGDKAKLILNGRELGTQPIGLDHIATFDVAYQPGILIAEVMKGGDTAAFEDHLTTAGSPHLFRLVADRPIFPSSRDSVTYITIEVVDTNKNLVPTNMIVSVTVSGHGTLEALGNANPLDVESVQSATHELWNGRGLAIVRASGKSGRVALHVKAAGLPTATMPLKTE